MLEGQEMVQPGWKTSYRFLKELHTEVLQEPAAALQGIGMGGQGQ